MLDDSSNHTPETRPMQPVGLRDSSRGSSAAIPPDGKAICILTLKGSQISGGTLSGCESLIDRVPGVCATASTPGYFMATLRVANPVDS